MITDHPFIDHNGPTYTNGPCGHEALDGQPCSKSYLEHAERVIVVPVTNQVDPDPMPVFVLQAKDRLSAATIRHYLALCGKYRLFDQATEVRKALREFDQWAARNQNKIKMPDHKHVPAR